MRKSIQPPEAEPVCTTYTQVCRYKQRLYAVHRCQSVRMGWSSDPSPHIYGRNKTVTTDHPVAYVSGLFRGSQLNWAALTKEAYAIYMSVKKLAFYLTDADVLLKSDHLPLKKFLQKNTLNNKVNNWAMELEAFNIRFEHVSSKANILANTLSRLIDLDPDARLDPENAGWEFGYYIFESLPKLSSADVVQVCEILSGENVIRPDPDVQQPFVQQLRSPLTLDELHASCRAKTTNAQH